MNRDDDLHRVHIIASITTGVLPSICMTLALMGVLLYFWGEYRIHRRLADRQAITLNSSIAESRESHRRQEKMLRKIAAHIGMNPGDIDKAQSRNVSDDENSLLDELANRYPIYYDK